MQHLLTLLGRRQLLLLLANVVYFSLINPQGGKSLVLFGGFLLLAIDIFLFCRLCLKLSNRVFGKQPGPTNRVAGVATLVVIVLLALQTIGQLSIRDTVAVICVGLIFLFYSSYYRFGHRG